jgi:hypothetical protein
MSSTLLALIPVLAALVALPLYLAAQVLALVKLQSGWRYAALLPLLLAITLAASALDSLSGAAGPSPRTMLLFSPGAIIYLALLALSSAGVEKLVTLRPMPEEAGGLAAPPGSR